MKNIYDIMYGEIRSCIIQQMSDYLDVHVGGQIIKKLHCFAIYPIQGAVDLMRLYYYQFRRHVKFGIGSVL